MTRIPLGTALLALTVVETLPAQVLSPRVGDPTPRWTSGVLEIHQISTGRGNSALVILPDGTSLLVDAGAAGDGIPETAPHPDSSRSPGAWIVRYLVRHLPDPSAGLDFALLTHFHPDHFGQAGPSSPFDSTGSFRRSGITEVGSALSIGTVIDRGWPDYSYPALLTDSSTVNYRRFLAWFQRRGGHVEGFRPGARDQIVQRRGNWRGAPVEIRNIVGNGIRWTGVGDSTQALFPPLASLPREDWPNENMCSLGIRISYGPFRFFTGGDLPGTPDPGFPSWHALEAAIAEVVGPVAVQVVNQHGSMGEESEPYLRTLSSSVFIIPAWAPSHPAPDVLKRLVNSRFPPAERFIFTTDLRNAARTVIGQRTNSLAGPPGHIVVRVEPGGTRYWVFVATNADESDRVLAVKGPFTARPE